MKKIICILLILLVHIVNGQLKLFGTDVSKQFNLPDSIYYKKIPCSGNPYYTVAEYKTMGRSKFLLFGDWNAKVRTPQMKEPGKYYSTIRDYITKTLNVPFNDLYVDSSLLKKRDRKCFWIKEQQSTFIVAVLQSASRTMENDFRIYIYNSREELLKGIEHIFSYQNTWEVMHYDRRILAEL